ncbi:hypothetical protein [Victivallis sp. Marseille-Q1083]|uniref:hypothetical protein n=1 Tax=Victivallis sp. Marseille-Q1083 TaxID=2717288 RepID=UPI00158C6546|nr:hypothetical protein [Victivallis sp. Marseille-Q1083]
MKKKQFLSLLGVALLSTPVVAAGTSNQYDLLHGVKDWKAEADGTMPIRITAADPLTVVAEPDGGAEDFPRVGYRGKPQDWRGYTRLKMRVKLDTEVKDIVAVGKNIAVTIYDDEYRHENLAGFPPVQQGAGNATVKVGDWQDIELNIAKIDRGAAIGLDVYLYEMPFSYPHEYRFEIAELKLIGEDTEMTLFDGGYLEPEALKSAAAVDAAAKLETRDGLSLTIGEHGEIADIGLDGFTVGGENDRISGVLLFDRKNGKAPVAAGGTVRQISPDAVEQVTELTDQGLKLTAEYRAFDDHITVNGTVASTNGEDRAITVYVALPVADFDWEWGKSLTRKSRPFLSSRKVPHLEERLTDYPFSSLSAEEGGLSMAIRLDEPTAYRLAVNPREKLYYVAFDIALLDEPKAAGGTLAAADFSVTIYRHDPNWGFRSAAESYYRFYPQFFVDRVGKGGGWELGWRETEDTPEELIKGGYRFFWGIDGARQYAAWNSENGVLNLVYIEPEFLQFSMGDDAEPTYEGTVERLKKLSDGDEEEWKKFLPLHYTQAYNCHPHADGIEIRPFVTALMHAAQVSGMYDRDGKPIMNLAYRPGWIGDSGFGAMIPCNLNPAIPGGKGLVNEDLCLIPTIAQIEETTGARIDGFGLDCFLDAPADYRRENFRYSTSPISFDPDTLQPMIPRGFSSVEWLNYMGDKYHAKDMVFMANAFGPITFSTPQLDIFGIENSSVWNPEFLRTMARQRPATYLPYHMQPMESIEYHLLWGIYPGRGIPADVLAPMIEVLDKLYAAGWEAVTLAVAEPREFLRIERFGQGKNQTLFFSVHNLNTEPVEATIDVDWEALKLNPAELEIRQIYPASEKLTATKTGWTMELKGQATVIVEVAPKQK